MTRHLPEFTLVIASLSLLAACGGSGSGDSSALLSIPQPLAFQALQTPL